MASYLKKVLPPNLDIDYTSNATVLVSIFKKVITPQVCCTYNEQLRPTKLIHDPSPSLLQITLDKRQKISVPERFSVQVRYR